MINKNNQTRERLKNNFLYHCNYIKDSSILKQSIRNTIENSDMYGDINLQKYDCVYNDTKTGNVSVVNMRTMEAARIYGATKKTAVLNFASARHPGGQVMEGSSAQEEALCRCSTLYQVLSDEKFKPFYNTYKEVKNFMPYYTNRLIYSPNVCVFGTDTYISDVMPEHLWYYCDVITCAAPNMLHIVREGKEINRDELYNILLSRVNNIINSAIIYGADVLVLGAFGCGVFKNPPELVAGAFKSVLFDNNKRKYFDDVVFAIIDDHRGNDNLSTFKSILLS